MKTQSKIEAAWSAYYEESKAADLDALHSEGWKTAVEASKESGVPLSAITQRLKRDPRMESKVVHIFFDGDQLRKVRVYRPKLVAVSGNKV